MSFPSHFHSRLAPALQAPDLRVVPIDSIRVHEDFDPSRCPALRDAIAQQGQLANPVIVGQLSTTAPGNHRFVHLDGANRLAVLRALGCTRVVVQVVDLYQPQQVGLATWAHRTQVDPIAFLAYLQSLSGAHVQPIAGDVSEAPAAAACIFLNNGAYQLTLRQPDVLTWVETLRAIVAFYSTRLERHKLPLVPEPQAVARHVRTGAHAERMALITFAPPPIESFLALALQGLTAPPGVTRFMLYGGRALGLNVALDCLGAGACAARVDACLVACREVLPVIVPGPCWVKEYAGWRDYDEPLLLYSAFRINSGLDNRRRLAPLARRTWAPHPEA